MRNALNWGVLPQLPLTAPSPQQTDTAKPLEVFLGRGTWRGFKPAKLEDPWSKAGGAAASWACSSDRALWIPQSTDFPSSLKLPQDVFGKKDFHREHVLLFSGFYSKASNTNQKSLPGFVFPAPMPGGFYFQLCKTQNSQSDSKIIRITHEHK